MELEPEAQQLLEPEFLYLISLYLKSKGFQASAESLKDELVRFSENEISLSATGKIERIISPIFYRFILPVLGKFSLGMEKAVLLG